MHSMKLEDTLVVGGVDAHADSHDAAVLDRRGGLLGTESFPHDDAWLLAVAGLVVRFRRGRGRRGRADRLLRGRVGALPA
jgi:hypothetical protein